MRKKGEIDTTTGDFESPAIYRTPDKPDKSVGNHSPPYELKVITCGDLGSPPSRDRRVAIRLDSDTSRLTVRSPHITFAPGACQSANALSGSTSQESEGAPGDMAIGTGKPGRRRTFREDTDASWRYCAIGSAAAGIV